MTRIVLMVVTALSFTHLASAQDAADEKLKRLIDRIVRGDEMDAADASEQLVDQIYGPLMKAISSRQDRPIEEQLRLRHALARLNAALRIRLHRLDLPEADRKLFDKFVKQYPDLTASLFDDHFKVRMAALDAIPLDRDSGAGLMIAARIDDEDADVAKRAIDYAVKLKDDVVGRGLVRYIRDVTAAVKDERYVKELSAELMPELAQIMLACLRALPVIKPADAAPVAADAFRAFVRAKQWNGAERAQVASILGELKDESVASVLLDAMESAQHAEFRASQGQTIVQTVGDAALLSLLGLFDLKPEAFGFVMSEESGKFAGFNDDRARQEGYRRFRIWHEQNKNKEKSKREPPASKPAG